MFRPHEGARLYTRVLLESQEGRGVGMFAKDAISCGATIVDEVKISHQNSLPLILILFINIRNIYNRKSFRNFQIPAIVGPKQTSPLVCMECLSPLSLQGMSTLIYNGLIFLSILNKMLL